MKMGMKKLMVAVAAAALMSGSAWAQMPDGPGECRPPFERAFGPQGDRGRWWNNPHIIEKLKLTEAQRKAMDEALLAHRSQLIDLHAALEKAELGMEPLMRADQPNEGQILAQIDRIVQTRAELEKARARFLLAVRSKLSLEQWKQMEADRAEHERRGFRFGGPCGPGALGGPGDRRLPRQRRQTPPPPNQPGAMNQPDAPMSGSPNGDVAALPPGPDGPEFVGPEPPAPPAEGFGPGR